MSAFVRPGKFERAAAVSFGACDAPAGFVEKLMVGSTVVSHAKFCASMRLLLRSNAVANSVLAKRPPPALTNAASSAAWLFNAAMSHEPAEMAGLFAILVPPSSPYAPRASGM
jgi:hypothetical protein